MADIHAHNLEIQKNIEDWKRKPLLREIYKGFHKAILAILRIVLSVL